MRLRSQIAALCLAALATPLSARPFSADDLLAAEEFGQVGVSPDGGHLVFERFAGQASSGPFDQDVATGYRRSRLYAVDLRRKGPALPLLAATQGEGQIAGPFSPDGARLAVMRFAGDRFEAGVVTLESGEVQWLGVTPELGWLGQSMAWLDKDQLVIAARPDGDAPMRLRVGQGQRRALETLWRQTAAGQAPSVRVVGSGSRLANMAPTPKGGLVVADTRTGEVRRLAEGEFYDIEISPDGGQVAAMQRLEPIQAPADWPLFVAGDFQRRNLVIANLASGEVKAPCPTCHLSTHLIAWSADSRELLVHGSIAGPYRGGGGYIRLAQGAAPKRVATPGLAPVIDRTSEGYEIPRGAWLGGAPLIRARPSAGGRADWWRLETGGPVNITRRLPGEPGALAGRQGEAVVMLAAGSAWRVNAGGRARRLFPATAAIPAAAPGLSSRLKVNAAAGPAWFRTPQRQGAPELLRSSDARQVILSSAPGRSLSLVAGAHLTAQVRRSAEGPMSLDLVQPDGRRRTLLQLNEPLLAVDFAHTLLLPTRTGKDSHVLLLPAHDRPGHRPPLVVVPYPGLVYDAAPEPYGRGTGRFSVNAEVLAGAGFAVLLPSLPRAPGEPGAGLAEQILAAVDQVAETGLVDADRLGIVGHSFGGYASLMAATQSPRFKTVIASAAPTDLAAMYGAFDPHLETEVQDGVNLNANFGWSELGQAGLKVPPWRDPGLYRRNSPYALADQISAPVMLIHGDGDFVRLSQAQAMFAALYRQGKDAELVTYFGEGHIVSSPANLRDMYQRMIGWLRDEQGATPVQAQTLTGPCRRLNRRTAMSASNLSLP